MDNQILGSVVEAAREVGVQDVLDTLGVPLLSIERSARHVRHSGVAAAERALGVAQGVVLGRGLGEPDVTTVAAQVAGADGFSDGILVDNGTTGGVDEPRSGLHFGNELLVEKTPGALVKRAVDGDNIALRHHLLKVLNAAGTNRLLDISGEGLVVIVQQLPAVEWLEASQDALTDTANTNSTNNLALEVELVLGDGSNIPVARGDLVVRRDEIPNQGQDGHDDVLSNGDDVTASDLGDRDTTVGLVGGVQVDVVGANSGSDGDLEVLRALQALGSEVAGVETSRWELDKDILDIDLRVLTV